jgi:hypothetical protein
MANKEHLAVFNQGVTAWNQWRREHPEILPDLRGANLLGTLGSHIPHPRAYLGQADLRDANLSHAKFDQAILPRANLERAILTGAHLQQSYLHETNFKNADLRDANLSQAWLEKALLFKANLERAILTGAHLQQSDLREANLKNADLRKADLRQADLREADLHGADLEGALLKEARLPKVSPVTSPRKIRVLQEHLTPEQEALARQFTQERLAMLLSCAPIDEGEAVWHLHQAYKVRGARLPTVRWFDSPFAFLLAYTSWQHWHAYVDDDSSDRWDPHAGPESTRLMAVVPPSLRESAWAIIGATIKAAVQNGMAAKSTWEAIWSRVQERRDVQKLLRGLQPYDWIWNQLHRSHYPGDDSALQRVVGEKFETNASRSICAYEKAADYDVVRFWQENLKYPDTADEKVLGLTHFAYFNEMVSGYRLGLFSAWLVRKPLQLHLDDEGRLHSASGMCLQYRDGWGLYAWHGVPLSKEAYVARPRKGQR